MRSPADIQKAHDILHDVVIDKAVEFNLSKADRDKLHAVHDALSWVLEGPCGYAFAKNLNRLQTEARELGYALKEIPKAETE